MKNWMLVGACCAMLFAGMGCENDSVENTSETLETAERNTIATEKEALKDGKNDLWADYDSPSIFTEDLEFGIADLPLEGEATNIPWAGSYWPTWKDSINHAWAGGDSLSPAAKYGEAFGVDNVELWVSYATGIQTYASHNTVCTIDTDCDATMAERCARRAGEEEGVCIPSWWGICHAWAPASILEPEPIHPVTRNGVTFEVNDIKALMTLAYNKTATKFVSLRCNENDMEGEIEYDAYNIPTGTDIACKDTNPGTFHVILANYLGIQGQSFVEDRTYDYQVWNQPLRGYRVLTTKEVTAQEANEMLGVEAEATAEAENNEVSFAGSVEPSAWHHEGPFDVAAGSTISLTMTGTGDADLYVAFGHAPSAYAYDCRPYLGTTSEEICNLIVPEGETELYVAVNGWHTTTAPSVFEVTILTPGENKAVVSESFAGTLAPGAWRHIAPLDVTPGQTTRVLMTGTGDADLYVRFNSQPTTAVFDCRSWQANSSEEFCELVVPASATTLHVSINGWHASDVDSTYDATVYIESPASVSETYLFNNAEAKSFYFFRTAVEYIFESPSWQNGNLSGNIDAYTGTDIYEYILEVDADGKITGGEWVGSSKQNHPDFLWLPIERVATQPIALGKIDYALLKELLLESVAPLENDEPVSSEEVVVTESGTLAKAEWAHFGPFVAGSGTFTAAITGTGDADLYVRIDEEPTSGQWDCRPYSGGSTENCSLQGPSTFFVSVRGYKASTFDLKITYSTPALHTPDAPPELELEPEPEGYHLNESGSLTLDEMKVYTLVVNSGQKIVVRTTAPNDIDVYLRMALPPTETVYDKRAYTSSGNEILQFTAGVHGTLHVGVHGYAASTFTMTTADE